MDTTNRQQPRSAVRIAKPLLGLILLVTGRSATDGCCQAADPAPTERLLDVRSFGALGDGVNDDTQALLAGIDQAVHTGRPLWLPRGTYLVSKPLRITAHGVHIIGDGANHTVLRASRPMNRLLYLRGTGMLISRLTLDANEKALYGLHAFHLNEQDSRIEFLRVVRARSHGIFLDHSQVCDISNCVSQGNGGDGFYVSDCNGTRISVCRAIDNRGRGFCVTRTDLSGGCWLLDCDAELNAREGLMVSDMAGTPVVIERLWAETNNKPRARGPHQFDAVRIASRNVLITKSRISTRGDAPVRPKYAIHLASETRLLLDSLSGRFRVGETVNGGESAARGVVSLVQADPQFGGDFPIPAPYRDWLARPRKLMLRDTSGSFAPGEPLTGEKSGATAVIRATDRVGAQNCVVSDNWIAREEGRAAVDQVHLDPGCTPNHIGRNFRMSSAGLAGVSYTDDPGSVTGDRSVTAGSGPPTRGRWPRGAFRFHRAPGVSQIEVLGEQLIENGDLEEETNWRPYGTPRVNTPSRERAHTGAQSWKVIGSGGAGVRQSLSKAQVGRTYRLSGWLSVSRGDARLIVHDGQRLRYGETHSDAAWAQVSIEFSVAAGSTPYVGAQSVGDAALFFLDDVRCQQVQRREQPARLLLGWVCTAAGEPGTWEPVYVLRE